MNSRNILHKEHESKFDRRVNDWLWRWWEVPAGRKVLIYDISLSLLPTVIAAIATAMANTNWRLFIVSYLLYGAFVAFVIRSHKLIARQFPEEDDPEFMPIALGIVLPSLVMGAVQIRLEHQMVTSLFITLGLALVIALCSQFYLALPKKYRKEAEATPITHPRIIKKRIYKILRTLWESKWVSTMVAWIPAVIYALCDYFYPASFR